MDNAIIESAGLPVVLLQEQKAVLDPLRQIIMVEDDSSARTAGRFIDAAKSFVKNVHDERMKITRKIDKVKKDVMAVESEWTDCVSKEISRVGQMVGSYLARVEAEKEAARIAAEEANAKLLEAAAINGTEVAKTALQSVPETSSKPVAGVSSRVYWGIRIVDPDAVPRAYCKPDETAIRQYMDSAKKNGADISTLHIEGVEFYKEIRV